MIVVINSHEWAAQENKISSYNKDSRILDVCVDLQEGVIFGEIVIGFSEEKLTSLVWRWKIEG